MNALLNSMWCCLGTDNTSALRKRYLFLVPCVTFSIIELGFLLFIRHKGLIQLPDNSFVALAIIAIGCGVMVALACLLGVAVCRCVGLKNIYLIFMILGALLQAWSSSVVAGASSTNIVYVVIGNFVSFGTICGIAWLTLKMNDRSERLRKKSQQLNRYDRY